MSNSLLHPKPESAMPCLALRPREAAQALGVSQRTLWSWTNEGTIPHVRRGGLVLYPVDVLRQWLANHAKPAKVDGVRAEGGAE